MISFLKKINRQHTSIQVERIIDYARKIGFNNISIDLMYGLPNQTITDIKNDLAKVRQLPIRAYFLLLTNFRRSYCLEKSKLSTA